MLHCIGEETFKIFFEMLKTSESGINKNVCERKIKRRYQQHAGECICLYGMPEPKGDCNL